MTGKPRTITVDATEEEYAAWQAGGLIQDHMPRVSRDDAEFLISGVTGAEYDEMWAENDKRLDEGEEG